MEGVAGSFSTTGPGGGAGVERGVVSGGVDATGCLTELAGATAAVGNTGTKAGNSDTKK
jgi:hypothetical protein